MKQFTPVYLVAQSLDEHIFLEHEITEKAKELLGMEGLVLEVGYSFTQSYSQGDGVCFMDLTLEKEDIERITGMSRSYLSNYTCKVKHDNTCRYMHECSMDYTVECYKKNGGEVSQDFYDEIEEAVKKAIQSICKQLKSFGYECIEAYDEAEILQAGREEFLHKNNIESDSRLDEFNYTTIPTDGYTHVATDGDASIKGLWVELPGVIENLRTTTTLENQKLISQVNETFYTFKNS